MDMAYELQHVLHEQAGIQPLSQELLHTPSVGTTAPTPACPNENMGILLFLKKKKEKGHSDLMLRSLSAAWFLDPHFWGLEYGLGCVCVCFKALEQETGRPEMFCYLWTLGQSFWLSGPQFPQLFKPGNWKKQVNFITYSFGQKLLQALHCVISFWGRSYALAPI